MFHEKYLRDFLLVCEKGNITGAARQLGLSQPSLSRIVKTVEKEAGMPLLVRDPNGVYLTQAGEIYARMARKLLEEYREALQERGHWKALSRKERTANPVTMPPSI